MVLRVCRICGLTAKTKEGLELFKKGKPYRYGRMNLCKVCNNELNRKNGKYGEAKLQANLKWRRRNSARIIRFKDKRVYLSIPVRTNVCSSCGRRYPDELEEPTHIHHVFYSSKNPLDFIVELCVFCHRKLHIELQKLIKRGCFDCGKDISYRGIRAIRCVPCQEAYRRDYMKRYYLTKMTQRTLLTEA